LPVEPTRAKAVIVVPKTDINSRKLYKTKITDICATDLAHLNGLKKLFIWQTEFGETGISQLKAAVPGVEVIGGYTLNTPPPSD
jgi:hypothetical protein